MFRRISLLLVCASLIAIACGSGVTGDRLVSKLPAFIPQPSEVSEQIDSQWQLVAVSDSTGEWNNQEMADSEGTSVREVEDGGRIDGYQVFYQGGPSPSYPLVSVSASLTVYRDVESAERALRRGPHWVAGPAVEHPGLVDTAVSWPMTAVSGEFINQTKPSCPCDMWIRVGRLVGTVEVQYGGPPRFGDEIDPGALRLAQTIAARMADAQG